MKVLMRLGRLMKSMFLEDEEEVLKIGGLLLF